MCNLYSVTKGQQAIRDLFAVKHDRAGSRDGEGPRAVPRYVVAFKT